MPDTLWVPPQFRAPASSLANVDLRDPVARHPLNVGLLHWWYQLPTTKKRNTITDLVYQDNLIHDPSTQYTFDEYSDGKSYLAKTLYKGTSAAVTTKTTPLLSNFTMHQRVRLDSSGVRPPGALRGLSNDRASISPASTYLNSGPGTDCRCGYVHEGVAWRDSGYVLPVNVEHDLALVYSNGTAYFYVDGILRISRSETWAVSASKTFGFLSVEGTFDGTANGTAYALSSRIYERALSFGEIQELWQIGKNRYDRLLNYRPRTKIFAVQQILSQIDGTSSVTFSQSGDLKGSAAAVASSTLTFSQSGLVAAAGALVGSSAASFSQTGDVTGAGALVGTSSLTFAQSGAVTGAGDLAGTSTLTFAATANCTDFSNLTGSSSISFSVSGTATGSAELSGSTAASFAAAGSVAGSAAAVGSATLTFAASGSLTADAAISGSTSVAFVASATISGGQGIVGSAALSLAASGTLGGTGQLIGTGSIALNVPGATMTGSGLLAGAVSLALVASGPISGSAACAGQSELIFALSGEAFVSLPVDGPYVVAAKSVYIPGAVAAEVFVARAASQVFVARAIITEVK